MEKITKNVQLILLIIILISTIIAVGIEIFTMVENKNVTFIKANAEKLPFNNSSIDKYIISFCEMGCNYKCTS